jgi:hypothetical protein
MAAPVKGGDDAGPAGPGRTAPSRPSHNLHRSFTVAAGPRRQDSLAVPLQIGGHVLPLLALLLLATPPTGLTAGSAAPPPPAAEVASLRVAELTQSEAGGLVPSARARALAATRVRLVGYMVRQEEREAGGFWLASRPVECDEGGGGTGDLPPGSVRVLVTGESPAPIDGPIAVTGVLEVGPDAGRDGPTSTFRLRLDRARQPFTPKP